MSERVSAKLCRSGLPVVVAIFAAALASCGESPPPQPKEPQTDAPAPNPKQPSVVVPTPEPVLTRNDLVEAAGRAASVYASGQELSAEDSLVGRTFSVRITFGCDGPALPGSEQPGIAHWSWGAERKTIVLRMLPADWKDAAMITQAGVSDKWEAVEGFWIARPWLRAEGCPAAKGDPLQTAAITSPQTLGLAAVFEAGGSRLSRRDGRAYQFSVRPKDAPLAPPSNGYRLLLQGRIESFPSGRAVECRASNPNERPVCVLAARLDRVAFETSGQEMLAEWRTD